jgi:hypothetical protein
MTMTGIFFLTTIISAFAIFAAVLAWGEYQTREAKQSRERGDLSSKPETVIRMKVDRAAKATVETEVTKAA